MKKLQLFKHVAGEIAKNKEKTPKMYIGSIDKDFDYISDGCVIWILPNKENPFKEVEERQDTFKDLLKYFNREKIEKVSKMITLQDDDIFDGKKLVRGKFKDKPFYFNPDLLKYFDKDCELYRSENSLLIGVKENGNLVGVVTPIRTDKKMDEKINKKLGL